MFTNLIAHQAIKRGLPVPPVGNAQTVEIKLRRRHYPKPFTGRKQLLVFNAAFGQAGYYKVFANQTGGQHKDCQATNTPPGNQSDTLFFIIDLDHFKRINDNYGHQAGDAVLVATQKRLSAIFRDSDYLVRWGGEEFLAVVQDTPREEAYLLAERIVDAVNSSDMSINRHTQLKVTCSVGFAAYPLHQHRFTFFDWQSTVGIADAALYGAKRRGRDTWMGITGIRSTVSDSSLELIKQQPARIFDHANVLVRQ